MKMKYIPMFLLFMFLYGILNYYVGNKILYGATAFLTINKVWFWGIFLFVAFSYMLAMLFSKFLPSYVNTSLLTIGSYWMAFFMYGLLIFPILDILNLVIIKFNLIQSRSLLINVEILLVAAFFLIVISIGTFNAKKSYVNSFNVTTSSSLVDGLNIVMVSDLHLGNLIGNKSIEKMVKEINSLKPDLVLIAGDIVDSDITPFIKNNMAKEFSKLATKYGTYATLGNHDLMTNSVDLLVQELNKNGVKILRNEAILLNDSFYVIGRDDISINRFGNKRTSLDHIVSNLDSSKLKILIDHTPSSLDESLKNNINLHFSGHTHKGQLSPANLITRKIFEIDHGHLLKDNLNVFVSSGYGTWGPPIRIGSKSEIVNVKINNP